MTTDELPRAPAAERNREPILGVLRREFGQVHRVLEIGSGTGQHAVYMARNMPHLQWQPTDLEPHLAVIDARRRLEGPENLEAPVALDADAAVWPHFDADAAFSANTVHIMAWKSVERMFFGLGALLGTGAPFCLYGPFHYHGRATAVSNARFDQALRARDTGSGIRDIDDLSVLASAAGFRLSGDHAMPANNRLLVWRRR